MARSDSSWKIYTVGGGEVSGNPANADGKLRFTTRDASASQYADAQLDDYQGLARRAFRWRPPLKLEVRARFSHGVGELRGTAGFGFWNDPLAITGRRWPALPGALWFFFSSPPSNMALAQGVAGRGWKAATLDARRWPALLVAPFAPLIVPLMNVGALYRRVWPLAQRALAVHERLLDDEVEMTAWHDYRLEWLAESARFYVDGELMLTVPTPPKGPLGFVMWLDNQYAIATPQGRFGWGLLASEGEQWMAVERFSIDTLELP